MRKIIQLSMHPGTNSYIFPHKCVYCGKPKIGAMILKDTRKNPIRQRMKLGRIEVTYLLYSLKLEVPYCMEHLRVAKMGRIILTIVTSVGFLLGIAQFVLFVISARRTEMAWETLLGVASFVGIFVCGALLPWVTRFVISRFFIKSFRHAPFLSTGSLGLEASMIAPTATINFSFTNDEIAKEFRQLNTPSYRAPR